MVNKLEKNTLRFLAGQFITAFGSQIFAFAMGLYILKTTGSAISFSITIAISMFPKMFAAPIAGYMNDRFDRKKMLVMIDFICGVITLIFFLISLRFFNVYLIYLLTFLLSILRVCDDVTVNAAIPNLKSKGVLKLNSLSQMVSSCARVFAPLIGGFAILYSNMSLFLLINALCFFIAAFLENLLEFESNVEDKQGNRKFFRSMKNGFDYTRSNKLILTLILFSLGMNAMFHLGYTITVPYIMNVTIGFSSTEYGILEGLTSAGAICASLALSRMKIDIYRLLYTSNVLLPVNLVIFGILSFFTDVPHMALMLLFALFKFTFGTLIITCNLSSMILLQTSAANEFRGRVLGFMAAIQSVLAPMAVFFAGFLSDKTPIWTMPILSGVILAGMAVAMIRRVTASHSGMEAKTLKAAS